MTKINNLGGDVWSEDDDLQLAEKVLSNVRQGGTLLDAFRSMEEETGGLRTLSASKYRWHTKVKKDYQAAFEMAKIDGARIKDAPKLNQGERYESLLENVLDKEVDQKLTIEDVFVVMKRYRDQTNEEDNETSAVERENKRLQNENDKLKREMKKLKEDLVMHQEALSGRNKQYKDLLDSLQVLRKAGIQINVPEENKSKYSINNDGTVDILD